MKKRRTARLGYFNEMECDALREAIKARLREASNHIGARLEPDEDIEDCNVPDQHTAYLSFSIPLPSLDEYLDVEVQVQHNPHMTLQFDLVVGDEDESYEVDLESANEERVLRVIGDAFNEGWAERSFSEVVWEALKPFLPEGVVPEARLSSYSSEMSAPMFRSDGEAELEIMLSDEIAEDPQMMGLVDVAYDMASQGGQINWPEMAEYVASIYDKYGASPELAKPADWDLVARGVHEKIMQTPLRGVGR